MNTLIVDITPKKLGIENIKTSFVKVLNFSEGIAKLAKKWSITAAISLLFELAEYKTLVSIFKQALKESKDLDPKESRELAAFFKEKFDIENDQLEARIEQGIELIPKTYLVIRDAVSVGAEWIDLVKSLKSSKAA